MESRRVLAAVLWDGGGDGSSFLDPLNWDTDQVPTSVDDVTIDVPGDLSIVVSGSANVRSLTTQEAIEFASGTFRVETTAEIDADASLGDASLAGGTWDIREGDLTFSSNRRNRLTDVDLLGELRLLQGNYVELYGDSTFTFARMTQTENATATLAFEPGSVVPGSISIDNTIPSTSSRPFSSRLNVVVDGEGSLTIPEGVTISIDATDDRANLTLGNFGDVIVNSGTIDASSGQLTFDNQGGSFTNHGHVQANSIVTTSPSGWNPSPTGTVKIESGGQFIIGGDVTTASLNLDRPGAFVNEGTVTLSASLDNTGDTLTLNSETGDWMLDAGQIVGGSVVYDGSELAFSRDRANRLTDVELIGRLALKGVAYVELYGDSTFTSAGMSETENGFGILAFEPGTVIPADISIDRTTSSRLEVVVDGEGSLTIPGGLTVAIDETDDQSSLTLGDFGDAIVNSGTIEASSGRLSLGLLGGEFTNHGHVRVSGLLSTLPNRNSFGQIWNPSPTGTVKIESGGQFIIGGDVTTASFNLDRPGAFVNEGNVTLSASLDNAGDTLELNAETGDWLLDQGQIVGGTVVYDGHGLGFTYEFENRLTDVNLIGELRFGAGEYVELYGDTKFTSARMTQVENGFGVLAFEPGSVVPGNIRLDNTTSSSFRVVVDGEGSLTIPDGVAISIDMTDDRSSLQLGDNLDGIVNSGTIEASSGQLSLGLLGGEFTNHGHIRVSGLLSTLPNRNSFGQIWNPSPTGTLKIDSGGEFVIGGDVTTASFNLDRPGAFVNEGNVTLSASLDNTGDTLELNSQTGDWLLDGGQIVGGTIVYAGSRLTFSDDRDNRLSGVDLIGELLVSGGEYVELYDETTYTTARLTADSVGAGFLAFEPDSIVPNNIFVDDTAFGFTLIAVDGAGTLTIPGGVQIEVNLDEDLFFPFFVSELNLGDADDIIVNSGTIEIKRGGLQVRGQNSQFTNHGHLQVGGVMDFGSGSVTWNPSPSGTIRIEENAFLNLNSDVATTVFNLETAGAFLNEGSVQIQAAANVDNRNRLLTLTPTTGNWHLSGGQITGGIVRYAGAELTFNSSEDNRLTDVELQGEIRLGGRQYLEVYGSTTFTSARLIRESGFSGNDFDSTELAFEPGKEVPGDILIEGSGSNQIRILADGPGSLVIPEDVTITVDTELPSAASASLGHSSAEEIVNRGTITVKNGGLRIGQTNDQFTNQGHLEIDDYLTIGNSSASTVWNAGSSGTIEIGPSGRIDVLADATTSVFNLETPGAFVNEGAFRLQNTLDNRNDTLRLTGATGDWVLIGEILGGVVEYAGSELVFGHARLTDVEVIGEIRLTERNSVALYGTTTYTSARIFQAANPGPTTPVTIAVEPGKAIPNDIIVEGPERQAVEIIADGDGDLIVPSDVNLLLNLESADIDVYFGTSRQSLIHRGVLSASRSALAGSVRVLAAPSVNEGILEIRDLPFTFDKNPSNVQVETLRGGTWIARDSAVFWFDQVTDLLSIDSTVVLEGIGSTFRSTTSNDLLANFESVLPDGDFTITGGRDLSPPGSVVNEGALRVGPESTLEILPGEILRSSSLLQVNGDVVSEQTLIEAGQLIGSGTISGLTTVQAGATLAPGNSPGAITLNDFVLEEDAVLNIETAGLVTSATAGVDYDQVIVTGTVQLDGELDIDIINNIEKGTQFTIIDNRGSDPIDGIFDGIAEGSVIDNGYDEYLITYRGGDGNDVVLTALTDVRVVLNTNDSGANSLRGEMIEANTIDDPVAVIFLIDGDGPHTISPESALPDVLGETFIDATTQPSYAGLPVVEVEGSLAGDHNGFQFPAEAGQSLIRGLAINRWQQNGIQINGASDVLIGANHLGTDPTGTIDRGNTLAGVSLVDGRGNQIGDPLPENRNLISGNDQAGVAIDGSAIGTIIEGNWIGLAADGASSLGNEIAGVRLTASENFVGFVGGASNVISGNNGAGVLLTGSASENEIVENWIGLTASGTALSPNRDSGVLIEPGADGNIVGSPGSGNVIAGTADPFAAVRVESTGNAIAGNSIGTTPDRTATLGSYRGVSLTTAGNTVGGFSFGDGNFIRGMATEAIDTVAGNLLLGNSIDDSGNLAGELPIDVDPDGVTTTRVPAINLAVSGFSSTTVAGTLVGTANTDYRIEVFSSPAPHVSSRGEGVTFLGFVDVRGGGSRNWSFSTDTLIPVGQFVSATASSFSEGTSEFSVSVPTIDSLLVTSTTDSSAAGTLRSAILAANSSGVGNVIEFDVPGNGPHTIALTSGLPTITSSIVIDGRSEPDFSGTPIIELDGGGSLNNAITLTGTNSQVLGLAIGGFIDNGDGAAIRADSNDVLIAGNYIGLRPDGITANENDFGISVGLSSGVRIGGSDIEDRNVIAAAITSNILASSLASETRIQGNVIGLSVDEQALYETSTGIESESANAIIGTDGDGIDDQTEGNIIAGHTGAGIEVGATAIIAGNLIGVISEGRTTRSNQTGIFVTGSGVRIGSNADGVSDPLERNVISGNTSAGIHIDAADNAVIAGNLIGSDVSGLLPVGNTGQGILLTGNSSLNRIGGDSAAARNLIVDSDIGIEFRGRTDEVGSNFVFGNWIGLDASGAAAIPNDWGMVVSANGANEIGFQPSTPGSAGNVIGGNRNGAIEIDSSGNLIRGNFFGTDGSGQTTLGDGRVTMTSNASNNRIGTATDTDVGRQRNVFAGDVSVDAATSDNHFFGNYFGIASDGMTLFGAGQFDLGGTTHEIGNTLGGGGNVFARDVTLTQASDTDFINNFVGVRGDGMTPTVPPSRLRVTGGSSQIRIGGPLDDEGNVIASLVIDSLEPGASQTNSNRVEGNLLGVADDGFTLIGTASPIVEITGSAAENLIGTPTAGNVIAGGINAIAVSVSGSDVVRNEINNNLIGLAIDGQTVLGNKSGIVADQASGTQIGGAVAGAGNTISGSVEYGIQLINAIDTTIQANRIGTDQTGTVPRPNAIAGIYGSGETVNTQIASNLVSGNGQYGIWIDGNLIREPGEGNEGEGGGEGEGGEGGEGGGGEGEAEPGLRGGGYTLVDNQIGTDFSGLTAVPNTIGIHIADVGDSLIGTGLPVDRNLISGNSAAGVSWTGTGEGNTIAGNWIGLAEDGIGPLGNQNGIVLGQSSTTIAENVVSGNRNVGIVIEGSVTGGAGATIFGNIVGLDADGRVEVGNAGYGIDVSSDGNQIGGTTADDRNIVSGNFAGGILLAGTGNSIFGNFVGTDINGLRGRGNQGSGVQLQSATSTTVSGNLISGNELHGILIDQSVEAFVEGNVIGLQADELFPIANLGAGIQVRDSINAWIGGIAAGQSNRIEYNRQSGIAVDSTSFATIRGNRIAFNEGLGIDFGPAGPTFLPVRARIDSVLAGTSSVITGTVVGTANHPVQVDFFASDVPDPSGFGEGARYLGSADVLTDATGGKAFALVLPFETFGGEFITATPSTAAQGTGEFSNTFAATSDAPPTILADSLIVTVIDEALEEAKYGIPERVINEGDALQLTGLFADTDSTPTVTVFWGDGTTSSATAPVPADANPVIRDDSFTALKTYLDDNPTETESDLYPVVVRVTDTDGSGSAVIGIRVNNVQPTLVQSDLVSTSISTTELVSLAGSFVDPGLKDIHEINVDWGDGSANQRIELPVGDRTFNLTHQYERPGDYRIRYSLFDDDRERTALRPGEVDFTYDQTRTVTVTDVQRQALIDAPISVDAGTSERISASVEGFLDSAELTYEWIVSAAGTPIFDSEQPSFDLVFDRHDSEYVIALTVRDSLGNAATDEVTVQIDNVVPQFTTDDIVLQSDGNAFGELIEGQSFVLSGSFTDPGVDNHRVEVDFGDGTVHIIDLHAGARSFAEIEHTFVDDPNNDLDEYPVTVTVFDGTTSHSVTLPVIVRNVAPSISLATGRLTDSTVQLVGSVVDPGINDIYRFEWVVDGTPIEGGIKTAIPRPSGRIVDVVFRAIDVVEESSAAEFRTKLLVLDENDNDVQISAGVGGEILVQVDGGPVSSIGTAERLSIAADAGDDVVSADASVGAALDVDGGAGNDFIESAGGNDNLISGSGDDTLISAAGDDVLVSSSGDDVLDGGGGSDRYRFVDFSDKRVIDSSGNDTLDFESIVQGRGQVDGIRIDLSIDDGTPQNAHARGTIALEGTLENVIGSPYRDLLRGNDEANQLFGGINDDSLIGGGNDSLVGGDGNDSLLGGGGDMLDGGMQNDTLVSGGGDTIFGGIDDDSVIGGAGDLIDGGDGDDVIIGGGGSLIDGGIGKDSIVGGQGGDSIFGGIKDDSIIGGSGGHNVIDGGDGDDLIVGGDAGGDWIEGGVGKDTLVGGSGDGDSVFGGIDDDSIIGGGGSEVILGGDGNDTISGGTGGSDLIDGGEGDDTIIGSDEAKDSIFGGIGDDSIISGGGDNLIGGGLGNDTVVGGGASETILGGSGNDVIDSADKDGDSIFGGIGDDSLIGGGGDQIIGDSGNDSIIGGLTGGETMVGGVGRDTIVGGGQGDSIFGGIHDDSLVGGGGQDVIDGGEGNDSIDGGDGGGNILIGGQGSDSLVGGSGDGDSIFGGIDDDTVLSGGGNDTIVAGDGNDSVVSGAGGGIDLVEGGNGDDTLIAGGGDSVFGGNGADVILAAGQDYVDGQAGRDTIIGSGGGGEIIFGGIDDDSIVSGGGADTIVAGDGNDTVVGGSDGGENIDGGAGDDLIVAGSGDGDSVFGGIDDDTVVGGGGNDTIDGGTGDDLIVGGPGGQASLIGSGGNDTIVTGAGDGDSIFGGIDDDSLVSGGGVDSINGGDGDDILIGTGDGAETLNGGSGEDTIVGGGGVGDSIFGGAGADVLVAGGIDTKIAGGVEPDGSVAADRIVYQSDGNQVLQGDADLGFILSDGVTVAELQGLDTVELIGDDGDNLIDARGYSGNLNLIGGGGNDTLLGGSGDDRLEGGAGNDSLIGGGGNDTYLFGGTEALGLDTVSDNGTSDGDTLDFFGLPVGVAIDLQKFGIQDVASSQLMIDLQTPEQFENVIGTVYQDNVRGNAGDNRIVGAGGGDFLFGDAGDDILVAARTRTAFLDFDSATGGTDHQYSPSERDAIEQRIRDDFQAFNVDVTQQRPTNEGFITVLFNEPPLVAGRLVPGGSASRIGFRDVDRGGLVKVDVNGFLGSQSTGSDADSNDFIALSSTIAAHELGHLFGLRHNDAFGLPDQGVFTRTRVDAFLPRFDGPKDALRTAEHLSASPASVGTTLTDALANPFFGARESLKLVLAESGESIAEEERLKTTSVQLGDIDHPVQPISLVDSPLPASLDGSGQPVFTPDSVSYATIVGQIELDGERSENDFYSFAAQQGDRVTVEVLSRTIRHRVPNTIDSMVRLYNSSGELLDYYGSPLGAFSDDGFEPTDSILIDVPIPIDTTAPAIDTYYVEVDTFHFFSDEFSNYVDGFDPTPICSNNSADIRCADTDTGQYELLIYRFNNFVPDSGFGDILIGGPGFDSLVLSAGQDTVLGEKSDRFEGPGSPETLFQNRPPTIQSLPNFQSDIGSIVQFTASGSDDDLFDEIHFTISPVDGQAYPTGAQMDQDTGLFSWLVDASGQYAISVNAVDLTGVMASEIVSIVVAGDQPPVLTITPTETHLNRSQNQTIVQFRFSDPVIGFDLSDVVTSGGTLSDLSSSGTVYTALFTAEPDFESVALISVSQGSYQGITGAPGLAATASLTIDTLAPFITDVIASSSMWSADFVDRVDGFNEDGTPVAGGNGRGFSLVGGHQLRSLSWATGIDQIDLVFSENVASAAFPAYLAVAGTNDTMPRIDIITYANDGSNVARIKFALPFTNDRVVLSVFQSLTDAAGNALLGSWTDELSTRSGEDGQASDFHFRFNVLAGDVNNSGDVDIMGDLYGSYPKLGRFLTTRDDYYYDLTTDGLVTWTGDLYTIFVLNGNSLPTQTPELPDDPLASDEEAIDALMSNLNDSLLTWDLTD